MGAVGAGDAILNHGLGHRFPSHLDPAQALRLAASPGHLSRIAEGHYRLARRTDGCQLGNLTSPVGDDDVLSCPALADVFC